jgi:transcriptional regulator with PAS, ATPase and Fis domain
VWSKRLPPDFEQVRAALKEPKTRVQLIVCVETLRQSRPYHVEPVVIPALKHRANELPRLVDEYADEAARELGAQVGLGPADSNWILKHSASSLWEIEKGTRRLVAIRKHDDNLAAAARALGMAQVSLMRWIGRRGLPGHTATLKTSSRTKKTR